MCLCISVYSKFYKFGCFGLQITRNFTQKKSSNIEIYLSHRFFSFRISPVSQCIFHSSRVFFTSVVYNRDLSAVVPETHPHITAPGAERAEMNRRALSLHTCCVFHQGKTFSPELSSSSPCVSVSILVMLLASNRWCFLEIQQMFVE